MRFSLSPKFGKSAGNLLVVTLLASAATGCSSDVTRFGSLFSSSGQDQMTTNSIPRRGFNGPQGDPVPVQFNPEGYTLSRDNNFAQAAVPGLSQPLLQFVHGSVPTLDA